MPALGLVSPTRKGAVARPPRAPLALLEQERDRFGNSRPSLAMVSVSTSRRGIELFYYAQSPARRGLESWLRGHRCAKASSGFPKAAI